MKDFSKIKIAAAALIIAGAALTAWQINTGSSTSENQPPVSAQFINGQSQNFNFKTGSSSVAEPTNLNQDAVQTGNLTDKLAQLYVQQIIDQNANGPTVNGSGQKQINMPSTDALANILQGNLNQQIQFKEFTVNDIIVSKDNSVQTQINYINALNEAAQKSSNDSNKTVFAALDNFLNQNDPTDLQNQINALDAQINNVLQIPVPSLWQQFDLESLNLWQKTVTIYQTFLSLNDDPLKTYLVLNDFQGVLDDAQSLNSVLIDRYHDLLTQK